MQYTDAPIGSVVQAILLSAGVPFPRDHPRLVVLRRPLGQPRLRLRAGQVLHLQRRAQWSLQQAGRLQMLARHIRGRS